MDIKKGSIVISKAGRDKGKWFLVLTVENNFAFISDGDLRKVENAKKKKLIHLQGTNYIVDLNDNIENFQIRGILEKYKPF